MIKAPDSKKRIVPKTVQSAWSIGLCALIIIKIFEKILVAVWAREVIHIGAFSIFAFLFCLAAAGILLKQSWGIGFAVVIATLDILVSSYTGGAESTISVLFSLAILLASFFTYRNVFDK